MLDQITNASVVLFNDAASNGGYIKYNNNSWQIRITAKSNDGFTLATNIDFSGVKAWIPITYKQIIKIK